MPKQIVIPNGMLEAGFDAVSAHFNKERFLVKTVIDSALHWLSENPIVPTQEQMQALRMNISDDYSLTHDYNSRAIFLIAQWQRRMFLAPEPNPVVLKVENTLAGSTLTREEANELIHYINECTHG